MKFYIDDNVFDVLPGLCIGVVAARGIANGPTSSSVSDIFLSEQEKLRERFNGLKPKEHPAVVPYRSAFQKLNVNPNKFMSSIEALTTRVAKGGALPLINNVVDLANTVSLRYLLPMGAHDMGRMKGDISIRFAKPGDKFTPFGSTEKEEVEDGELVYADSEEVRTRKWIWRQGNNAKIENNSCDIFFPIDGFLGINDDKVVQAAEELEKLLKEYFGCETVRDFADINNRSIQL